MTSLDRVSVKTNDDVNHNDNDDDNKNSPHVAKQRPLRVLESARRIVLSYSEIFVSRPWKSKLKDSLVPFSLLLYLHLKSAKRELSKIGNEEGKTLTFGKQNHSHGHVC